MEECAETTKELIINSNNWFFLTERIIIIPHLFLVNATLPFGSFHNMKCFFVAEQTCDI